MPLDKKAFTFLFNNITNPCVILSWGGDGNSGYFGVLLFGNEYSTSTMSNGLLRLTWATNKVYYYSTSGSTQQFNALGGTTYYTIIGE